MSLVQTFKNPAEFIATFETLVKQGEFLACVITGGVSESTGKNWCPDCDAAKPFITPILQANTSYPTLIGLVEDRSTWVGRQDHPFKLHPTIKARGVPTMLLFSDGTEVLRVDDQKDFENEELMAMFNGN